MINKVYLKDLKEEHYYRDIVADFLSQKDCQWFSKLAVCFYCLVVLHSDFNFAQYSSLHSSYNDKGFESHLHCPMPVSRAKLLIFKVSWFLWVQTS